MLKGIPPPPQDGGSKKSKIVIAVLIGAILVMAVIAGINFLGQPSNNVPANNIPANDIPTNIIPLRAVLKVDGGVTNGYWTRDVATDLPDYESTVSYSVSDAGNLDASNVSISISIDGNIHSSNIIPSITMSNSYSSTFSVTTPYDSTSNVQIQAACHDSSDSDTLMVGSMFPRTWTQDPNVMKLFITPNETSVINMKNTILQGKFFLTADWIAIRDWVGSNVQYKFDNVSHGQEDYWQFSKETLALRKGDCEDSAILLCSLLRADGVSARDVYVVVGETQGVGHAWVSFKLFSLFGQDSWVRMEPTAGGNIAVDFFADLFSTFEGRNTYCSFNDVYYTGQ